MNAFPHNSTVILVHGAWADGSCWRDVILPLERQGLRVICAPIPLTSLSDDVSALTRVVERTEGPVVLGGHAYGGAVIAGIRDERVKSLVYVAALAPEEGETVAQVFYRDEPHAEAPKLSPDKYGFIWMLEDGFRRAVAHNASSEQTRILSAVQRPISVQCIQEEAPVPGWPNGCKDPLKSRRPQPDVHRDPLCCRCDSGSGSREPFAVARLQGFEGKK